MAYSKTRGDNLLRLYNRLLWGFYLSNLIKFTRSEVLEISENEKRMKTVVKQPFHAE